MNCTSPVRAFALFIAVAAATTAMTLPAVEPVVFWDGAVSDHDFSTLTRTVGDNTYTLNLNEMNTVGGNGSYIQIGNQDAKAAVTLTAQNVNPAITNGFGAAGAVTVIMKCSNAPVSAASNRALLSLLDDKKYKGGAVGSDNSVKIGVSHWAGSAYFAWQGHYWTAAGASVSVAGKFTAGNNVVALTYSSSNGTAFYVNGEQINYKSNLKADVFKAPCGIALGGVDTDSSTEYAALTGMKIEAVAVFTNTLSSAEVSGFRFPSIWASEVNAQYGEETEITLDVADGTCIIGDTAFNATKINFTCNGSLSVRPPAENTTAFDFSGVTGEAAVSYSAIPTVDGDYFTSTTVPTWVTDSARWTNTIALVGMSIADPNFNAYGNAESSIRMSGVSGYINTGTEYIVPIVLENGPYDFALKITNGNSPQSAGPNVNRCAMLRKISGTGSIVDGINKDAKPVFKVYDADGFSGSVTLNAASLVVCNPDTTFSDTLYNLFVANGGEGAFYVASGKAATVADGKVWNARHLTSYGSLTVNGTITASVAETFHGSIAGSGRIVASGFLPSMSTSPNIDLENWTGTFALSNIAQAYPFNIHLFSSTNSTLEVTSIGTTKAYLAGGVKAGKVVVTDNGDTHAIALSDGLSDYCTTFCELAGTGTISQSKDGITQGLTVNVMTNFTGTLLLNKMSVTFGSAQRTRKSGLYIDSDAILSVPAGFALWNPPSVAIDGPVNFTTNSDICDGMVLFDGIGSSATIGENASFSINGVAIDKDVYSVRKRNGQVVVRERRGFLGVVK